MSKLICYFDVTNMSRIVNDQFLRICDGAYRVKSEYFVGVKCATLYYLKLLSI